MGKRKGKCVKKNPSSKESLEPEHLVKAPHSFVIHRGQCSKDLIDLMKDFRKLMEPFTASQLKVRFLCDFSNLCTFLRFLINRGCKKCFLDLVVVSIMVVVNKKALET